MFRCADRLMLLAKVAFYKVLMARCKISVESFSTPAIMSRYHTTQGGLTFKCGVM
jgi:hypothetical protein